MEPAKTNIRVTDMACIDGHSTDHFEQGPHKGPGDTPTPVSELAAYCGGHHLKEGVKNNEHRAIGGDW
ncbi:MAG TPA: hypothetical protein ENJ87_09655 [Gammaproteobacteria bacterium]|nr:hypothetical protein [Gammaproteobacteria bacterium]